MAMTAADDVALALDLFGPVVNTPPAATPIPYAYWKIEGLLFSRFQPSLYETTHNFIFLNMLWASHVFIQFYTVVGTRGNDCSGDEHNLRLHHGAPS